MSGIFNTNKIRKMQFVDSNGVSHRVRKGYYQPFGGTASKFFQEGVCLTSRLSTTSKDSIQYLDDDNSWKTGTLTNTTLPIGSIFNNDVVYATSLSTGFSISENHKIMFNQLTITSLKNYKCVGTFGNAFILAQESATTTDYANKRIHNLFTSVKLITIEIDDESPIGDNILHHDDWVHNYRFNIVTVTIPNNAVITKIICTISMCIVKTKDNQSLYKLTKSGDTYSFTSITPVFDITPVPTGYASSDMVYDIFYNSDESLALAAYNIIHQSTVFENLITTFSIYTSNDGVNWNRKGVKNFTSKFYGNTSSITKVTCFYVMSATVYENLVYLIASPAYKTNYTATTNVYTMLESYRIGYIKNDSEYMNICESPVYKIDNQYSSLLFTYQERPSNADYDLITDNYKRAFPTLIFKSRFLFAPLIQIHTVSNNTYFYGNTFVYYDIADDRKVYLIAQKYLDDGWYTKVHAGATPEEINTNTCLLDVEYDGKKFFVATNEGLYRISPTTRSELSDSLNAYQCIGTADPSNKPTYSFVKFI